VRDLGQRIILVHELRQLRGAEEFLDRGRHRLGVDHFLRHQRFGLGDGQPFLDRALDAHQANSESVLSHFADGPHTPIAQMVNVVNAAVAIADIDQNLQDVEDVFLGQHIGTRDLLAAHTAVELHAADGRNVVALVVEEQVVEQILGGVLGGRLAGAHHAIDLDQRLEARLGRIDPQRVGDVRAAIQIIGVQRVDALDAGLDQLLDAHRGQHFVGLGDDFAGIGVGHVVRQHLAIQVVARHGQQLCARILELAHVARSDAAAFLDDHLVTDADLETGGLAAQALRYQLHRHAVDRQVDGVLLEEDVEDLGLVHAKCAKNDRNRKFATSIDTRKHAILRIELEIQPRAAIGNDARREQQLPRRMRLAAVVIEEYPGRAVQLADDDPLGTVDDEGAVVGHQRQLAEINLLFAHVLDGLLGAGRLLVEDDEPHLHAQRRRVGEAAQLAFLDVEHRLAQAIAHVLERRIARIAGNREHALEGRVQSAIHPRVLGRIRLQEAAVGVELDGQQAAPGGFPAACRNPCGCAFSR
jgi:hypothetical protein